MVFHTFIITQIVYVIVTFKSTTFSLSRAHMQGIIKRQTRLENGMENGTKNGLLEDLTVICL